MTCGQNFETLFFEMSLGESSV